MNQNINVDLIPKFAVYGNLYFSQYDVGREAIINLVNGSTEYEIPSGATVTLVATKPSGLGFTQNCTFEGNQITVVCTAEMTDEAGHFPCEIRIANGSLLLGTANFTFNVERSPHPEGTTDGTAESVVNQITLALNDALEQIDEECATFLQTLTLGIDDEDGLLYLYVNGAKQGEGIDIGGGATRFTITYSLANNIVSSNTATKVSENAEYHSTISSTDPNYLVDAISVTMGGVDITASSVNNNNINIANVTGDLIISVTALYYPSVVADTNLLNILSGQSGTVGVKLGGEPTQEQTVSVFGTGVTVSPSTLAFTDATWNTYQNVVITASSVDETTYASVVLRNSDPLMTDTSVSVVISVPSYSDLVDMTIPSGQTVVTLSDFASTTAYQGGTMLGAYNGSATNIKVPLSLDPNGKLWINNNTFKGNTSLQYIEIEPEVKQLNSKWFSGMTSLIGLKYRCSGITNMEEMFCGDVSFKWWDGLTLNSNATTMSGFLGDGNVNKVFAIDYLPDLSSFAKLTSLSTAFMGCTNLKKVFGLPSSYNSPCSMTSAFYNCYQLENLVIGENVSNASHALRFSSGRAGALKKVIIYDDNLTSSSAGNIFTNNKSGADVYAHNNTDTWTTLVPYVASGNIELHDLSGGADLPVIVTWGDSTTSPGTSWGAWPERLQAKLGTNNFVVRNEAVSGEYTTSTSARQGGNTLKVIDGFTIPASGETGNIVLGTRDGLVFGGTGTQAGGAFSCGGSFNPCIVENVIGSISNNSGYKFLRLESGSLVEVAADSYVYSNQDDDYNNSNTIMLIDLGVNSGWNFSSSLLLTQVQYMVNHFLAKGGTKYIVCGPNAGKHLDPDVLYYRPEGRAATLEYENLAAQAFGNHWLNLRTYGIEYGLSQNNLTPTAKDTERMENGLWPSSLLNADLVHPNSYGANTQMLAFYEKGVALGYWN